MMISLGQRHMYANRLRTLYPADPIPTDRDSKLIRDAIQLQAGQELFKKLADLIDRQTCWNTYDGSEMGSCTNGFRCSECGNVVEDYEGYRVSGEFNYCSKCGAIVVGRKPTRIGALKNEDL